MTLGGATSETLSLVNIICVSGGGFATGRISFRFALSILIYSVQCGSTCTENQLRNAWSFQQPQLNVRHDLKLLKRANSPEGL